MFYVDIMNVLLPYVLAIGLLIAVHQSTSKTINKPHVIFIVADDLGWNDIGIHNPDIVSPFMDEAARSGIILNASYVQPVCSPSRAAFLTGCYPHRTGFQEYVVPQFAQMGLPLQFPLLPQVLKNNSYDTHLIGKWHLGFCNKMYLPTNRGFDTYFGYLGPGEHYYTHSYPLTDDPPGISAPGLLEVYDFWNQTTPSVEYNGTYSSIPMMLQLKHILKSKNNNNPLFIQIAMQTAHCPIEVPEDKTLWYPNVQNPVRQKYSALVTQMDNDFGQIIQQLKAHKIYDNSIIILTSDNGGDYKSGGNNYPLRGNKATLYEGGTRATSFIHSPLLTKTGYTYNGLMHAVDWFPTIVKLAGGTPDKNLDGIDMWNAITKNKKSPRNSFVYNLNVDANGTFNGAIRRGDWKLIFGGAGLPNSIIKPNDVTGQLFNACGGSFTFDPNPLPFQLYNIKDDPTENNDLAQQNISQVNFLYSEAESYKLEMVKPVFSTNNVALYKNLTQNLQILNTNWCTAVYYVTKMF